MGPQSAQPISPAVEHAEALAVLRPIGRLAWYGDVNDPVVLSWMVESACIQVTPLLPAAGGLPQEEKLGVVWWHVSTCIPHEYIAAEHRAACLAMANRTLAGVPLGQREAFVVGYIQQCLPSIYAATQAEYTRQQAQPQLRQPPMQSSQRPPATSTHAPSSGWDTFMRWWNLLKPCVGPASFCHGTPPPPPPQLPPMRFPVECSWWGSGSSAVWRCQ